uniref:Uncharacterized protein n=1 Tax=Anguilla anguilla TaxID=7936 RepID=A0A0E9XWH5_ANGAN
MHSDLPYYLPTDTRASQFK